MSFLHRSPLPRSLARLEYVAHNQPVRATCAKAQTQCHRCATVALRRACIRPAADLRPSTGQRTRGTEQRPGAARSKQQSKRAETIGNELAQRGKRNTFLDARYEAWQRECQRRARLTRRLRPSIRRQHWRGRSDAVAGREDAPAFSARAPEEAQVAAPLQHRWR